MVKIREQAFKIIPLDNSNAMSALGMEIVDKISKLQGVCTTVTYKLNGSVLVAIQPPGDGTEFKKGMMLDAVRCHIVGPGIGHVAPSKGPEYSLGVELEDSINGFKGIATEYTFHINGCITYLLNAKMEKTMDGIKIVQHDVEQDYIKKPANAKKAATKVTGTGGSAQESRFDRSI